MNELDFKRRKPEGKYLMETPLILFFETKVLASILWMFWYINDSELKQS